MTLVVTVTTNARQRERQRAQLVAERCGSTVVPRPKDFDELLATNLVYIVGRAKDELRAGDTRLAVNPGLLRARLHTGTDHPLIAAIAPTGTAAHVIDGTLGLAGDALHLAGALGCRVTGIEISPVLFCLNEEGMARMATDSKAQVADAASRVTPVLGDSAQLLGDGPADCADAVLLAPMYRAPDKAAPGFELLRGVAVHGELSPAHVEASLYAAPRLVVKWPRGVEPPAAVAHATVIHGRSVDYLLLTR